MNVLRMIISIKDMEFLFLKNKKEIEIINIIAYFSRDGFCQELGTFESKYTVKHKAYNSPGVPVNSPKGPGKTSKM